MPDQGPQPPDNPLDQRSHARREMLREASPGRRGEDTQSHPPSVSGNVRSMLQHALAEPAREAGEGGTNPSLSASSDAGKASKSHPNAARGERAGVVEDLEHRGHEPTDPDPLSVRLIRAPVTAPKNRRDNLLRTVSHSHAFVRGTLVGLTLATEDFLVTITDFQNEVYWMHRHSGVTREPFCLRPQHLIHYIQTNECQILYMRDSVVFVGISVFAG